MAYQFIQDAYQTKRGAVGRRGCLMCAAKAVPSMCRFPKRMAQVRCGECMSTVLSI